MKANANHTRKICSRSANEQLLKGAHDVMSDAIREWDTPDSPEAFCYAMKGLMIHRDRIAARLGISDNQPNKR